MNVYEIALTTTFGVIGILAATAVTGCAIVYFIECTSIRAHPDHFVNDSPVLYYAAKWSRMLFNYKFWCVVYPGMSRAPQHYKYRTARRKIRQSGSPTACLVYLVCPPAVWVPRSTTRRHRSLLTAMAYNREHIYFEPDQLSGEAE